MTFSFFPVDNLCGDRVCAGEPRGEVCGESPRGPPDPVRGHE